MLRFEEENFGYWEMGNLTPFGPLSAGNRIGRPTPESPIFGPMMPADGIYARPVSSLNLENVHRAVTAPDGCPERIFLDVE